MDIKEEDRMHLMGIVDSIREIQGYVGQDNWKDYSQDTDVQQSISSHLQQIGSAAALLSDDFKDDYREVDWDVLKGFQYANYDQELELDFHPQWHIIKEDLPVFLEQIEDLVSEIQRDETFEDDLTTTGSEDEYKLDTTSEEYLNRRSGDQLSEEEEDFEVSEENDNLLDRLEVIGDNIVGESDEPKMVQLSDDIETEDDSFIDQRYEDVELMEGSSLDDHLEEEEK